MPRKSISFIWASKDRKTEWTKHYTLIHPDGTVVTWTVEKVSILHPNTHQFANIKSGQIRVMRVLPVSAPVFDIKTGRPVRHTSYYIFSQSFSGGPGSSRDKLGGFATGQYQEVYEDRYKKNMALIRSWGFKVKRG